MTMHCASGKLAKLRKIFFSGIFGLITVSAPVSAEYVIGTHVINVDIIYKAPTCDIVAPQEVFLGNLDKGQIDHKPFSISVNCKDDTKTALTATIIKGSALGTDTVSMSNGSLLRIRKNNSNVSLDGDDKKAFCLGQGAGERSCELIPQTEVRDTAYTDELGV